MESEEILGPQFTGSWSTCSPIPGKQFPITHHVERLSLKGALTIAVDPDS